MNTKRVTDTVSGQIDAPFFAQSTALPCVACHAANGAQPMAIVA